MELEFHPQQWLDVLTHYPWMVPLLAGAFVGTSFTQLVKKLATGFTRVAVSDSRYKASVQLLAVVATFAATQLLWPYFVHHVPTGLGHLVSAFSGICAPKSYDITKALIAWRFPELAKRLGDNGGSDGPQRPNVA